MAAGYSFAAITKAQSEKFTAKALLGLGFDVCELNVFDDPIRTWDRCNTPKPEESSNEYLQKLQMRRKAETLKHSKNAMPTSRRERLKSILRGQKQKCTQGKTFTSSNKDGTSNPNSNNLQRINNSLIIPNVVSQTSNPSPSYNSNVPGNTLLFLDNTISISIQKEVHVH